MAKTGKSSNVLTGILIAAVVALIAINISYVLHQRSGDRAQVDEPAPNFTLPLLNADENDENDEIELASLQGKVVLLEFWSTT